MSAIFPWLLCAACLLSGFILLAQSLAAYAMGQSVARRFRIHVSPSLKAPWMAEQAGMLLEQLGRLAAGSNALTALQDCLLRAGYFAPAAPYVFVGLRLIATLTAAGLAVLPPWLHHGQIAAKNATLAFFLGFLVYRGFTFYLKARAESRARDIRRELPYVLDLLLMVLDAGVSVDQALHHVSQQIARTAPVTAILMARYIADTDEGLPYDKALDRLAQRLSIQEGRDFAGLLKQNLFQGGELGQPLHRLAGDISEARLAFAREQIGKKSVLLTLTMLFFFMPVLLVAVAGPAVSDVLGTLSHVAQDMQAHRNRP